MDIEIKRQVVHSVGIFVILLIPLFGKWVASLIILASIIFLICLVQYRKKMRKLEKYLFFRVLNKLEYLIEVFIRNFERHEESLRGIIIFLLGSLIVIAVFPEHIAAISIVVLALGDSIATLVGKFFGKHKLFINNRKSWEGSLSFFIISFSILLFFINPLKAFTIAFLTTCVEMMPTVDDNITIPIAVAILLWI